MQLLDQQNLRTIAVVGCSPKPDRPSYQVAQYLLTAGFTVIPVNPGQETILGQTCYPNLTVVPHAIDLVDIFRRAEEIDPVVNEAIVVGARVLWLQLGIVNESAARKAAAAGLFVIMDRCLKVEHQRLLAEKDSPGFM